MSAFWLLAAFAAVSIFEARSATHPAGQDNTDVDLAASLFGYKPCIDETCEDYHIYGPSALEPKDPASQAGKPELPRAHCMLLRPSAVNLFGEIETMYPGISDIKYRVLEELVEYMHQYSSLKFKNCEPNMQLIDLVILAANSLKTQYALQGDSECIYESSEEDIGKPVESEETKVPCNQESSGYETGTTVCPGSTMKSELETTTPAMPKPTEKPYQPSSTQRVSEKPYIPSSTARSIVEPSISPYPDGVTTEKPCPESDAVTEEEIEIVAEDDESELKIPQVGSLRGIPGVHYPNYTDIPITSFTCADKKYMPGFFADLDTGCQVFHVCYEHRRESFLCPVGTIFNQPILACDYWYSSNCSLASHYYDVNEKTELEEEKIDAEVQEILTLIEETEKPADELSVEGDLDEIAQFFPVKVIVTDTRPEVVVSTEPTTSSAEIASEIVDKMATTATKVISSTRHVIQSIPEPVVLKPVFKPVKPVFKKPMKMTDLLKESVVPLVKAKLAAIPISKATAFKTAVPIAALAKTKAAVPVLAKAKVAAAIPAAKVAAAVPVLAKAKVAAAIPAAKLAASVPVLAKAKVAAAIPAAKVAIAAPAIAKIAGKTAAVPIFAKAKVAVAAPVVAKAKVAVPAAKVAAAVPIIAKGKIAVPAFKVAAAKVAAKSSLPVLKTKMIASAVPLMKTKAVPLMKAKVVKSAGTPLLKAKMLALPLAKSKLAGPLPLAKVKLAKAAAISPLTKKALALGYMKLLKAKKIALMG